MPEFVIERNMPGVGALGAEDLKGAPQTRSAGAIELRMVPSMSKRKAAKLRPGNSRRLVN